MASPEMLNAMMTLRQPGTQEAPLSRITNVPLDRMPLEGEQIQQRQQAMRLLMMLLSQLMGGQQGPPMEPQGVTDPGQNPEAFQSEIDPLAGMM